MLPSKYGVNTIIPIIYIWLGVNAPYEANKYKLAKQMEVISAVIDTFSKNSFWLNFLVSYMVL